MIKTGFLSCRSEIEMLKLFGKGIAVAIYTRYYRE